MAEDCDAGRDDAGAIAVLDRLQEQGGAPQENYDLCYLLARIAAALERIADAQETIAATPLEACGGFDEREDLKAETAEVLSRDGAFREMQAEAQRIGASFDTNAAPVRAGAGFAAPITRGVAFAPADDGGFYTSVLPEALAATLIVDDPHEDAPRGGTETVKCGADGCARDAIVVQGDRAYCGAHFFPHAATLT